MDNVIFENPSRPRQSHSRWNQRTVETPSLARRAVEAPRFHDQQDTRSAFATCTDAARQGEPVDSRMDRGIGLVESADDLDIVYPLPSPTKADATWLSRSESVWDPANACRPQHQKSSQACEDPVPASSTTRMSSGRNDIRSGLTGDFLTELDDDGLSGQAAECPSDGGQDVRKHANRVEITRGDLPTRAQSPRLPGRRSLSVSSEQSARPDAGASCYRLSSPSSQDAAERNRASASPPIRSGDPETHKARIEVVVPRRSRRNLRPRRPASLAVQSDSDCVRDSSFKYRRGKGENMPRGTSRRRRGRNRSPSVLTPTQHGQSGASIISSRGGYPQSPTHSGVNMASGPLGGRATLTVLPVTSGATVAVLVAVVDDWATASSLLDRPTAWGLSCGPAHGIQLADFMVKQVPFANCWMVTATIPRPESHIVAGEDRRSRTACSAANGSTGSARPDDRNDSDDSDDSDDSGSIYGAGPGQTAAKPRQSVRGNWTLEEDDDLKRWVVDGKSWTWISGQFPGRSTPAVYSHWYSKLKPARGRSTERRRRTGTQASHGPRRA